MGATKKQTKLATLLWCGFEVINRILHRCVVRGMRRQMLDEILHVRLADKAYQRGHKSMTVLGDRVHGVVLDVHEGREIDSF